MSQYTLVFSRDGSIRFDIVPARRRSQDRLENLCDVRLESSSVPQGSIVECSYTVGPFPAQLMESLPSGPRIVIPFPARRRLPAPRTVNRPRMETPPGAMGKYRQIGFLKEAGLDVDPDEYRTDPGKIDRFLSAGVDYKDKKKRYWVDPRGRDCFAIYARGLNIDNSDRSEFWQWTTDSTGIELANVVTTTWLGVNGSFRTVQLSQMVSYKVSFRLRTTRASSMAGKMVDLILTLPDGTKQVKQAQLPAVSSNDDSWDELEVGQFSMSAQNVGEMRFAMEKLFESWVTGLVIKSVEIKPV